VPDGPVLVMIGKVLAEVIAAQERIPDRHQRRLPG
jgi:hypothetical protein